MHRVIVVVAALAASVVPAVGSSAADRDEARPVTVAVIGDTPYGADQADPATFEGLIDEIGAARGVRTLIHLGDIKNGSTRCDDEYFDQIAEAFDRSRDPVVYTPGDNEWTDCHRTNNGGYDPYERLDAVRNTFFPDPGRTLGRRPIRVTSQGGEFVENVHWTQADVVLATVHVVGSNNGLAPWTAPLETPEAAARREAEVARRIDAAVEWIDEVFDVAESGDAPGVVVAMQADTFVGGPTPSGFVDVLARLGERAAAFDGDVLLLQGDTHRYLTDQPFPEAPNLTRVVVEGETVGEWLKLTIDPGADEVFRWERVPALAPGEPVTFGVVGTYSTGLGEASGEIVAYSDDRAYVINTASTAVDILTVGADGSLDLLRRVDLGAYGAGGNSVAVAGGVVAVALDAPVRTDPGQVVLLDRDGNVLTSVTAGAVPDMVTFTPDGRRVLVANEGEPSDDYTIDPEGSVSVIDVRAALDGGRRRRSAVATARLDQIRIPSRVRIFGPGASAAEDLEPEYITVTPDGRTAYVSLQENNAVGVLDVRRARFIRVIPLGVKDHGTAFNALDANDRDGIAIAPAPVVGMYQPDAVASFVDDGRTYIVSANEGDVREYDGFAEAVRADDLTLDPTAFPTGVPPALARLNVTTATGDTDGDGDIDVIHAFGGRSFSIWTGDGRLVFDSGGDIERRIAELDPAAFNVSNSNNTVDNRSDDKGPEPEGVAVGTIAGRRLAFIALERVGGVLIYDITDPAAPVFQSWANNRTYGGPVVGPDSGPEGLAFVPAAESPTGWPLLLVGNEISGTVTAYGLTR